MPPTTLAILGAGSRGRWCFAETLRQWPELARVVAVAEPDRARRDNLADACGIPPSHRFEDWHAFVGRPRLCDAVVVATLDREHAEPAIACLRQGYDVLLEKPMGISIEECRAIADARRTSGAILAVCHSLRYQRGFRQVHDLVRQGFVGRVMSMDMVEQVIWWHQAHSYVRGNWGVEDRSAPMLLAKSCHDLDYLAFLAGKPARRLTSYGHLSYYRQTNAPAGAPTRCADGCPHEPECPYSALRLYVHTDRTAWPAAVCSPLDHSVEAHQQAVRTGPYGRCVWRCDNDVVDHQVVAMQFPDEITATFTMTAFTQRGGRRLRIFGTEGDLTFDETKIEVRRFDRGHACWTYETPPESGGHGGGDARLLREWLEAVRTRDATRVLTSAEESLRTHAMVFAAETSRREGRQVDMAELGL